MGVTRVGILLSVLLGASVSSFEICVEKSTDFIFGFDLRTDNHTKVPAVGCVSYCYNLFSSSLPTV